MGKKGALDSCPSDNADSDSISWASQGVLEHGLMTNSLGTAEEKTEATDRLMTKKYLLPTPKQFEEIYLEMLIGAIQALSSDYEIQTSLLHPDSDQPDELLSIFEDCYALVGVIYSSGLLDESTVSKIKRLYFMLTRLNVESDYWTVEAMKSSPEWEAIRTLAKEVLEVTGGEISKPKSGWPVYE